MSEYTEQAENFLKKHDLKFRATYQKTAPYFDDDTDARDIYLVTISGHGRGRYSTRFGASFNMTRNGETPNVYDVLATKYDPETFENFCAEFGYDTDSRRAEKTYRAVARDWRKVSKFFTAEELDELQEIS